MMFALRTMCTGGGRAVRIPKGHVLAGVGEWSGKTRVLPVAVRWKRLCAFLLLHPLQRLGHRYILKQRHCLLHVAFAAQAFKLWNYLIRETATCMRHERADMHHDNIVSHRLLSYALHHICEHELHVWHLEHVLRNYLSFQACSSFCLRLIVRYARSILHGYHGKRLTSSAIGRFVQLMSWRRNSYLRQHNGSTSDLITSTDGTQCKEDAD
jgi:hypothetical protein